MKPTDRQKLCSNCDGRIPYDAFQCPYCFSQQHTDATPSKNISPSSNDPLLALYPPPYASEARDSKAGPSPQAMVAEEESSAGASAPFWPILMLVVGSNLFTVGLLQFFFSDHGAVHLEMNASYWFLMVLVGAPLAYFGIKKFSS